MGVVSKAKAGWKCKKELAVVAGAAMVGSGGIAEKAVKVAVNCGAVMAAYERGRKNALDE